MTVPTGYCIAAALVIAGLVTACSSVVDRIPHAAGGLPANAPERSETPAAYPDVQATPQTRSELPLTDDEQNRLRTELNGVRTRQEERAAAPNQDSNPAKPKKKPKDGAGLRPSKDANQ